MAECDFENPIFEDYDDNDLPEPPMELPDPVQRIISN